MADLTPVGPGAERNRLPPPLFIPNGGVQGDVDDGPTLRSALAAIRRHLWIVVLFAAVGVGLTAIALQRTETLYASRAVIQLPEQGAGGGGALAGIAASLGGGGGSINSQAEVIRSRLLLGQVVDSLGLRLHREVPGIPRNRYRPVGWVEDVWISPGVESGVLDFEFAESGLTVAMDGREVRAGYGDPIEFPGLRFTVAGHPGLDEVRLYVVSRKSATDALLQVTRPLIRDGTNIIDIVVDGYDPLVTERIADLTAGLYRQFTVQRAREQAERQHDFVLDQLAATEELLRQTQDELTEFRRREGLYSSRAQAVMDQTGQAELDLQEAQLVAERQVFQRLLQRLAEAEEAERSDILRSIVVSPSIASNPVIMSEYNDMRAYQLQRDSLLMGAAALSRNNRDVRGLDSLIVAAEGALVQLAQGHVASLDAQIAALRMVGTRVDSAFQHLAATEPEEIRYMLALEAIGEAATELRARSYTAGMVEAGLVEEVTILDEALPGEPLGTGPIRALLLGLVLGLLVGGAGAMVLDSANQSIRRRDELERVLRIPGLGVIPQIQANGASRTRLKLPTSFWSTNGQLRNGSANELIAATAVHSAGAEAYRSVRTNLAFVQSLDGPRSIMVTSPSNGEGKTMTAANLAVTFAHQGRRVLLVDADLRRARLHHLFEAKREPGLSEVLAGSVDARAAIRPTAVPRLELLTAGGSLNVSAADLLAGDAVRRLLTEVGDAYDVILVDSPPVLLTADAPILATQVDGVLLIVRAGQTERETAQYAIHQLVAVGADVLGAVLNDPDAMLSGRNAYTMGAYTAG